MSLMIMKHNISDSIRGAMPKEENAKKFLSQIADCFIASEKVETSMHLSKLVLMRYNVKENIREYIMEMSNLVTKLRALKLEFSEKILVPSFVLSSCTIWSFNEPIVHYVQEEEIRREEKDRECLFGNSSSWKSKHQ